MLTVRCLILLEKSDSQLAGKGTIIVILPSLRLVTSVKSQRTSR
jgi:hypothetical protein